MMLITSGTGLPSDAISTCGARCSTFAFTNSWTARAFVGHLFGLEPAAHSFDQLDSEGNGVRLRFGVIPSK
jgi:hypothetical protein